MTRSITLSKKLWLQAGRKAGWLKQAESQKEYVIWGTPKNGDSDTLLLSMFEDKPIVDAVLARKLAKLIESKYGATKVRIQELDLSKELDWKSEIGIGKKAELARQADEITPGEITVYYSSVDGVRKRRTFKTLAGANKYARDMIGDFPTVATNYAVSDDGIGKIQVRGTTLEELFDERFVAGIRAEKEGVKAAWKKLVDDINAGMDAIFNMPRGGSSQAPLADETSYGEKYASWLYKTDDKSLRLEAADPKNWHHDVSIRAAATLRDIQGQKRGSWEIEAHYAGRKNTVKTDFVVGDDAAKAFLDAAQQAFGWLQKKLRDVPHSMWPSEWDGASD